MKVFGVILVIIAVIAGGFFYFDSSANRTVNASNEVEEVVDLGPKISIEEYVIQDDDTFTSVMGELGVVYSDALDIVESGADVYNLTRIRAGKVIRVVSEDGVRVRIEYEPNPDDMVVVAFDDDWTVSIVPIEYDIEVHRVDVTIDESLFLSGLNAGLSDVLLLKYVDVFAWEVDFATQVQKGDSYTVLYEQRYRDGQEKGIGNVLYASFKSADDESEAFLFIDEDGEAKYYDENGNSMVRTFLKAPLSYTRITSGYTEARFHPVTGTVMPHRAIDYGAAIGTPIHAVADGKVTFAQWSGGYGNYIHLKHNSVYETRYAHLSRYNVSAGDTVHQGDVIGYVGSTGWSTGPHLHYEVLVNGQKMNPEEVEFPKGDGIMEENRAEFDRQSAHIRELLN